MNRHGRLMAKIGAVLALSVLAEILIDDGKGAVVGGFAFAWTTALLLTRRAIWKARSARLALISGFKCGEIDAVAIQRSATDSVLRAPRAKREMPLRARDADAIVAQSREVGLEHQMTIFLSGVPGELVRAAFDRAGGNEIASGKFASPESSAALAANGFGWFMDRPTALPAFPGTDDLDWPATRVDLEREMRFPWSGGRHP